MSKDLKKANTRVVSKTLLAVVGMFAFGYALIPIYNSVCEVLGINGKTEQIAGTEAAQRGVDRSRTVHVSFDATTNSRLPWRFEPLVESVDVHPGQVVQVRYKATNLSGADIIGQATHSVAPQKAASHFKKTECFCYSQQPLKSGETREMPVVFMIDPDLPEGIEEVTLSYTFFRADKYAAR